MFCMWNKFTNREGQLYGFQLFMLVFERGVYATQEAKRLDPASSAG